jgi:hypothetical protein
VGSSWAPERRRQTTMRRLLFALITAALAALPAITAFAETAWD